MGVNIDDGQVQCIWNKHPEVSAWAQGRYPAGYDSTIAGKKNIVITYFGGPYADLEFMALNVWGCPPSGGGFTTPLETPPFPGGQAPPPIPIDSVLDTTPYGGTGGGGGGTGGDGGGTGGIGAIIGDPGAWLAQNKTLAIVGGGVAVWFLFLRGRSRRKGLF